MSPPKGRRRVRTRLQAMRNRGLERLMLMAGGILLAAVAAELVLLTVFFREAGWMMWRAVGVELVAGREAAIPIAVQSGAPRWFVAQVSATQDIGGFLVLYPLVLRLMARRSKGQGWLTVRLRRIQADAEQRRGFVRRLGGFGIFLFMLVPFLVNGPLIGGLAGRLAGMRTTDVLVPVVASTCIAAAAWTYFYDQVLSFAGDLHPAAPYVLTGVVLGLVLGTLVVKETLQIRRERKASKSD